VDPVRCIADPDSDPTFQVTPDPALKQGHINNYTYICHQMTMQEDVLTVISCSMQKYM
jgi:hypothetical protein